MPLNFTHYATLYPQNGDRIVAIDSVIILHHMYTRYYVYNGSITLMSVVYVAVIYFVFLICICVLAVLVTIVVQYLHLRSESKPFRAMPSWVST